tara:strand:- start:38 stop:793 length:756 start_codon:yes stop_codon:yes gene_type:complete
MAENLIVPKFIMAGHSHWAGIKHKKGKADKIKSKIFSKLSREITVAAKLGDKNPDVNSRLRSAIQSARSANMPKDNIARAIDKSEQITDSNFENIRYEGFGPNNIAVIVETLTDNKNRTASNIRTIFQKGGGRLGTQGSASHNFKQIGVIKIEKKIINDEKLFELAINSGANECISDKEFYEIHCKTNEIYSVKKKLEENIDNFVSTEIEWLPLNNVELLEDQKDGTIKFLESLEDNDDVQNVYSNVSFKG